MELIDCKISEIEKLKKASHQGRVILTYGRSLMSLVIARSLGQQGIEVIGCDDVDLTVLQFSNHVKETFVHPPYDEDPEHFLEVMEKKVLEFAPADDRPYVLMPVFRETKLFAANRNWFEPAIKIATPSIDSISMVDPKDKLAKTAGSIGLDTPKTWILRSADDVDNIEGELDYPVLIKPASGVGGRGVEQIDGRLHLERYLDANNIDIVWPLLVQELVNGEDYCCPIIADHGQIKAIAAYQNLATFPRKAGAGAVRKSTDHQPFLETVEKLVAHTNWTGIAQIDFRWNGQDAPKLIEVNARFWAGLFHSLSSGIDFPKALYELTAFGKVSSIGPVDKSKITKSTAIWLPAILEDVVRSDDSFVEIIQAWEATKTKIGDGEVREAIQSALKNSVSMNKSLIEVVDFLRDEISNIKHAPTELSDSDDPFVGLGILFVLGSLYRHGKFPPEILYKSDKPKERSSFQRGHNRQRPNIGITRPDDGDWLSYQAIRFAVWLAGGHPLPLTARAPHEPHLIDGLVFGGGGDIYPQRFGASPKPGYIYDHGRDDMEITWNEAARNSDIPVLGICRGAQTMNVAAGGTLHLDLSAFIEENYPTHIFHQIFYRKMIEIKPQSHLHRLTGAECLRVNSIHQQAIEKVGLGYIVSAREKNGLIQAIENPDRLFAVGLQFHPEFLICHSKFRQLFKGLVTAARTRMNIKETNAH